MGAAQFQNLQRGDDAEVAFREAREAAQWEYGHGGYGGTLAEKGSYSLIQTVPLPEKEAFALADRLLEQDDRRVCDKWGPAGALPVVLDTREETITIPEFVHDSACSREEGQAALHEAALAVLRRKRRLRRGEKVKAVTVTSFAYEPTNRFGGFGGYGGYRNTKQKRTNMGVVVTLAKPKSKMTRTAVATQTPDAWLFFGYASS